MPSLTASGKMSSNTASSCWARNSGDASRAARTPAVFWAVRAVMAVIAYTPLESIVLISA